MLGVLLIPMCQTWQAKGPFLQCGSGGCFVKQVIVVRKQTQRAEGGHPLSTLWLTKAFSCHQAWVLWSFTGGLLSGVGWLQ